MVVEIHRWPGMGNGIHTIHTYPMVELSAELLGRAPAVAELRDELQIIRHREAALTPSARAFVAMLHPRFGRPSPPRPATPAPQ